MILTGDPEPIRMRRIDVQVRTQTLEPELIRKSDVRVILIIVQSDVPVAVEVEITPTSVVILLLREATQGLLTPDQGAYGQAPVPEVAPVAVELVAVVEVVLEAQAEIINKII